MEMSSAQNAGFDPEASRILDAIKADNFKLRDHAVRRSDQHILSRHSVMNVAKTVIKWKYQADKYSYWFIGFLEKDRPGGFSAVINDGIWVVTVFKRRLSRSERKLLPLEQSR
jgi:hypothetical protein